MGRFSIPLVLAERRVLQTYITQLRTGLARISANLRFEPQCGRLVLANNDVKIFVCIMQWKEEHARRYQTNSHATMRASTTATATAT